MHSDFFSIGKVVREGSGVSDEEKRDDHNIIMMFMIPDNNNRQKSSSYVPMYALLNHRCNNKLVEGNVSFNSSHFVFIPVNIKEVRLL